MAIVKYDEHGFEVVAERKGHSYLENSFVRTQIFQHDAPIKPLKFSAYHGGNFFGTIHQLLKSIEPRLPFDNESRNGTTRRSIRYLPADQIKNAAEELLTQIGYVTGPVNLTKICSKLAIGLEFSKQSVHDAEGMLILGSANFDHNAILINEHENKKRERFTLGHEIGHFCLDHKQYLISDTVIATDLLINGDSVKPYNFERLEVQANTFASDLILPEGAFRYATEICRIELDIKDRTHGYIYVDDQPCNSQTYWHVLENLSEYFQVSKQAIEIKLKRLGLVNDQRRLNQRPFGAQPLGKALHL
nr:ImmA/IrrE family metallo-endopeptidase [Neorhizobium galegae]